MPPPENIFMAILVAVGAMFVLYALFRHPQG